MKKLLALILALAATVSFSFAAGEGWSDDYEKSVAQAKTEKKYVLLDFTGSDFCQPCMLMVKHVFSKDDFKEFAKTSLVLVELDFPLKKELPEKTVKQNDELQEKFKVGGYPTFILLDAEGKELYRGMGFKVDIVNELKKAIEDSKAK